jgi:hypothetical protein
LGLFVSDTFKLLPSVTLDVGLRYRLQTTPNRAGDFAPRAGLAWALDKKQKWIIHLRGGLFPRTAADLDSIVQLYRLSGTREQAMEVYSPNFTDPLTPAPGAIQVSTVNHFPRSFGQMNTSLHTSI